MGEYVNKQTNMYVCIYSYVCTKELFYYVLCKILSYCERNFFTMYYVKQKNFA